MTGHGRVSEYLDGALGADEEAAFLAHLAGCAECQAELDAEVQLRDREDTARGAAGPGAHELHGRAGEYLDGTLDSGVEAAYLDHMATCARCQRELHDEVQLRDREDALRDAASAARGAAAGAASSSEVPPDSTQTPPGAGAVSLPRRGRRGVAWAIAGAVASAAAAAALVLLLLRKPGPPSTTGEPIALALRPTRAIEIRLSHAVAAKHRPYDTMRNDAGSSEPIPPAVVAQLDRAGDCHGVATAHVLAGELVRADEQYRRCPAGLDIDADLAGLAVLRGEHAAALDLTEQVLDDAPDHTVALWNRALALRAFGLELSAAAAFERMAALERSRDPAWAQEAGVRAAAMRAELDRMRTAYEDVERLGLKMALGGPPLDSGLARRVPARSRVWLHNALRVATTPARLDELAPLAAALEGLAGDDLGRYVAQARVRLSPAQAAAAAGYRAIVVEGSGAIADPEWASWLALATRAKADDLILGARIVTGRLDGTPSAEQLAAATRDPWFERAVELERAAAALNAGRIEDGAARLAAIQAHCRSGATPYRCLHLAVALARLTLAHHKPPEARDHALTALAISRRLNEWPQRAQALTLAGDAERFGGGFGPARAYYEEAIRSRDPCDAREITFAMAEMLYQRHRFAEARELVAAAPACDQAPTTVEVATLARLLRSGHAVLDRGVVTARIARARAAPELARDAVFFDFLVEWIALDQDPAARERLARLDDAARGLEGSMREKMILYLDGALLADAGRRGVWADVLAIAARARGVAPPRRCALAIGADDFRFAAVGVGPDGALTGLYEPDLVRPHEWLAPERMRRALAGCDDVAVLALPPWLGIRLLLDAQTPWHYVLGPARPPTAGRRRHVVIADPASPPSAGLARFVPRNWPPSPTGPDELITGPEATPERVLAAISDATLVEIHGHAIELDPLDAPVLALSPGADGWMLDAARIRDAVLTGAPVVVLADCAGGASARFEHQAWGLPLAFRTAGASAVIASFAAIPDRDAAGFFDAVIAELAGGASPAAAVARVRAEKMRVDPTSWVRHVVVFQ
jgi:tetratricopeptide (TPR) repeat protein